MNRAEDAQAGRSRPRGGVHIKGATVHAADEFAEDEPRGVWVIARSLAGHPVRLERRSADGVEDFAPLVHGVPHPHVSVPATGSRREWAREARGASGRRLLLDVPERRRTGCPRCASASARSRSPPCRDTQTRGCTCRHVNKGGSGCSATVDPRACRHGGAGRGPPPLRTEPPVLRVRGVVAPTSGRWRRLRRAWSCSSSCTGCASSLAPVVARSRRGRPGELAGCRHGTPSRVRRLPTG